MTQVAEGDWSAAVAALDRALAVGEQVDDRDVLWNLGNAALQLGDDAAQQHFYGYALSRAREAGAVTAVVYCLQRLCFGHFLAGDLVARAQQRRGGHRAGVRASANRRWRALPDRLAGLLAALQGRDDHDELAGAARRARGGVPAGDPRPTLSTT